jgi:DNA-directed RNA polymerase specialized sigma24 family protein
MAQQLAAREYAVIDEDALIERLRQGDEAAFEGLFLRHYAQVYRVLYHLVGSREEAKDLAQETFMALYHQPPATGMGASVVAWLCRVALLFSALSTSRGYTRRNQWISIHIATSSPWDCAASLTDPCLPQPALAFLPVRVSVSTPRQVKAARGHKKTVRVAPP